MLRGTDDNGYGFERKHSNVYQPTAVELKIHKTKDRETRTPLETGSNVAVILLINGLK
jgi:hypothetical protein